LQITALSPHPCGLPRPSGNVSAILRPSAPAVSSSVVKKLKAGRTNGRPDKAQPPSGKKANVFFVSNKKTAPYFVGYPTFWVQFISVVFYGYYQATFSEGGFH
ncbi:hypothetical protein, partial [Klebsiella aerogenes]|uniref:hypothetical protein n=1 Tax=Klebsiella aerogenes TaxID=548 RepID=UPI003A98734E